MSRILSAGRCARATRILYRSLRGKAKLGLLLTLAALATASPPPGGAIAEGAIGTVSTVLGSAELSRAGSVAPLDLGASVLSGDAVETAIGSNVSITLSDGGVMMLGEVARATLGRGATGGPQSVLTVALQKGSVLIDRPAPAGAIVLIGNHGSARPLTPSARWSMRTDARSTDVAAIEGRVMVTHRHLYWRITLGAGTGISRIPRGDVHKFRLPKARLLSASRLEAIFPQPTP